MYISVHFIRRWTASINIQTDNGEYNGQGKTEVYACKVTAAILYGIMINNNNNTLSTYLKTIACSELPNWLPNIISS